MTQLLQRWYYTTIIIYPLLILLKVQSKFYQIPTFSKLKTIWL